MANRSINEEQVKIIIETESIKTKDYSNISDAELSEEEREKYIIEMLEKNKRY